MAPASPTRAVVVPIISSSGISVRSKLIRFWTTMLTAESIAVRPSQ